MNEKLNIEKITKRLDKNIDKLVSIKSNLQEPLGNGDPEHQALLMKNVADDLIDLSIQTHAGGTGTE